ncbi:MAG: helix-turn-helix transcriptional regulator [Candidatus Margulisiibacteriota bacterium]
MNSNQFKTEFINLLRSFRERKGLNKSQLATMIGVSPTSAIKYEDPKSPNKPGSKTLAKICMVLELSEQDRQSLYAAASLTEDDIDRIDTMLRGLVSPMFDKNVVDVITRQEMLNALGMLSKMDKKKLDQALKSVEAVVKGFS